MSASRKDSFTIQILQIFDAFLVGSSLLLGFWISNLVRESLRGFLSMGYAGDFSLTSITWVFYIAVPFTPLILERFGFYEKARLKKAHIAAWQIIQAVFFIGVMISVVTLFAKINESPRLILGTGALCMFLILFSRERLTSSWMRRARKQGIGRERVIIAGSKSEISNFLEELDHESIDQWEVVAHFDLSTRSPEELFGILKKESICRVIFCTHSTEFEKVATAVEICELQGVEAWIAASFMRSHIARPTFDSVGSKPMLVLRSTPELSWALLAKEVIDRVVSFLAIILTSPFWLFAYIGIKIASPGAPVIFSQMRAGRYGKPFRMFKFRTMVANAEEMLISTKQEHGNEMDGPVFKLHHDPRVFQFGSLLRRLSIDELPQLINVLMGNMSMVGPRPLPLYEVEAFSKISHRRRLSIRPGITCEWQVGGRNKITSFEDWVAMDLRYIDNWSLWLDFQIMLKTIPAVLFGRGAK